jgi:hypothetical protein
MNNVRFKNTWFNPLYFILNKIIQDKGIRIVFVYGGKSSAKTASITQMLTKELVLKNASTIAFRKESSIIPTTLKKSFNLAIDTTRLGPAIERQDRKYINTLSGKSEIVLKGLDDPEKAKGVESYKYIYLDELNHFEQAEYEQFNLSLRGIPGQKIFASWNPVDENSWVKTEVDSYQWEDTDRFGTLPCENSFIRISSDGKAILIKTTYEDNYWIVGSPDGSYGYRDENLIAEYEALRTKNYNSYKVNVLGEWGKTTYGGEFLKCWKSETHTGQHKYDPTQAIWLSFDENVVPYFPCGIFQVGNDCKSPRLIHAIAAKTPNNKVSWMTREIERKLTEWGHKERLFVTGDATSQKDDVKLEEGDDMFRLIMAGLQKFRPQRMVSKSNPSVRMSADFFNSLLEGNVNRMTFGVDQSCRVAINDYENTKEDKNGKVDKTTVEDPITKVRYQPFGHFVDLTRYFLVTAFPGEYSQYQRGGIIIAPTTGKNVSKNSY